MGSLAYFLPSKELQQRSLYTPHGISAITIACISTQHEGDIMMGLSATDSICAVACSGDADVPRNVADSKQHDVQHVP